VWILPAREEKLEQAMTFDAAVVVRLVAVHVPLRGTKLVGRADALARVLDEVDAVGARDADVGEVNARSLAEGAFFD
jgi:hypothetical protein